MNLVVPWVVLVPVIEPHASVGKTGRPPFAALAMLRIRFIPHWLGFPDPAIEEALHDGPLYCEFAQLGAGISRLPDESMILRFPHLLEEHNLGLHLLATINKPLIAKGLLLKTGPAVDATLIAAPSSTKNSTGERYPEMHQTKKGNQWHFGMKAHIGVDADSGLVHTVIGTAANVNDVTQGHVLLHGEETVVFADAGYQGLVNRPKAAGVDGNVAMRLGKRRALNKNLPWGRLLDKAEQPKASVRAKVEHPFRVIKCQFGFTKVRCKGLTKNTAQLMTLFALSNVWMARKHLIGAWG